MKVLLTRTHENNERSAKRLAESGFQSVSLALGKLVDTGISVAPESADGIIITSAAAVEILVERGISLSDDLPVYCVGETTANRLQSADIAKPGLVCATAADLADRIKSTTNDLRQTGRMHLLYLAGKDRAFDFGNAFTNTGVSVEVAEIYAIERIDPGKGSFLRAMEEAKGGIQFHFSAESAAWFFELVEKHACAAASRSMNAITISEKTSQRADFSLVKTLQHAKMPTQEGMIEVLKELSRAEQAGN